MLEGTSHAARHSTGGGETTHNRDLAPERRRREMLAQLSAMSLAAFGHPQEIGRDTEAEATAVARAWLDLVDVGLPDLSWGAAAPTLRAAIGVEDWRAALRAARIPLGRCRSRKLLHRHAVEAFPGVPPGTYLVIRFESAFEGETQVFETVAVQHGDDGRWRPVSYFIR